MYLSLFAPSAITVKLAFCFISLPTQHNLHYSILIVSISCVVLCVFFCSPKRPATSSQVSSVRVSAFCIAPRHRSPLFLSGLALSGTKVARFLLRFLLYPMNNNFFSRRDIASSVIFARPSILKRDFPRKLSIQQKVTKSW